MVDANVFDDFCCVIDRECPGTLVGIGAISRDVFRLTAGSIDQWVGHYKNLIYTQNMPMRILVDDMGYETRENGTAEFYVVGRFRNVSGS